MKPKTFLLFCVISLIFIIFMSCSYSNKYDKEWIIGKTSIEIIEKYGEFDTLTATLGEDGLYRYGIGSYIIRPKRVGYLGTTPETLFSISFDENGIAYECFEEMGGKGG